MVSLLADANKFLWFFKSIRNKLVKYPVWIRYCTLRQSLFVAMDCIKRKISFCRIFLSPEGKLADRRMPSGNYSRKESQFLNEAMVVGRGC